MPKTLKTTDPNYPLLLKQLINHPSELRYIGEFPSTERIIAVVGSRKMTSYGDSVIKSLVGDLVNCGFVIVSGLAPGIDSTAQKLAIELGGKTIGVLGYGFSCLSRLDSLELAREIESSNAGAVVSPFCDSQKPTKWTFIERNKIIAGLAQAVLVVESTEKSGAHYTVNAALDLNRDVYAVPGSIFSNCSVGNHSLLKDGAKLATNALDILDYLAPAPTHSVDNIAQ